MKNCNVELVASRIERSKSIINFDIINTENNERIFEIYDEKENFIDGIFKIKIIILAEYYSLGSLIEGIEKVCKYIFDYFPIRKIQIVLLENEKKIIQALYCNEFKNEACLREDTYIDGKYVNKLILSKFRC